MAAKKFIVELDDQERERLNALISKGKAPAKTILALGTAAKILGAAASRQCCPLSGQSMPTWRIAISAPDNPHWARCAVRSPEEKRGISMPL